MQHKLTGVPSRIVFFQPPDKEPSGYKSQLLVFLLLIVKHYVKLSQNNVVSLSFSKRAGFLSLRPLVLTNI